MNFFAKSKNSLFWGRSARRASLLAPCGDERALPQADRRGSGEGGGSAPDRACR